MLSGRCAATTAWKRAGSKLDEPAKPSDCSGITTQAAPRVSGAITPAMFSSSTAKGRAHRWRRMSSGSSACTRPSATRRMAVALRHTPLGAPVVPEVKVILAVSGGIRTAPAGRRRQASVWPATSQLVAGNSGQRAAASGMVSIVSTPAAPSACVICAGVKNTGSGTCTTPASDAARSATIQAGALSISVAKTRVPRPRRNAAKRSTSSRSASRLH